MDYLPAKLYKGKKEWYVVYGIYDEKGNLKRRRLRQGINYIKSLKRRNEAGLDLVRATNKLLEEGWRELGKAPPQENVIRTLKALLLELLETKRPPATDPETYRKYKNRLNHFTTWLDKKHLADLEPDEFTRAMAFQYCDSLTSERKYAGKTFNVTKENLSSYFNMMIEREIIQANPFTKIKRKKEVDSTHVAFSKEQQIEIHNYLLEHDPDVLFFAEHIEHCYIRRTELLKIKKPQYDLVNENITIYGKSGKNRRQLIKVIPKSFIYKVKSYHDWDSIPDDWYIFGKDLKPSPLPMKPNSVTTRYTKVLRKLGYGKEFTLYGNKHTGVVEAIMAGIDIVHINLQLGHSNLNQSMKYARSLGHARNNEFATKKPAL